MLIDFNESDSALRGGAGRAAKFLGLFMCQAGARDESKISSR